MPNRPKYIKVDLKPKQMCEVLDQFDERQLGHLFQNDSSPNKFPLTLSLYEDGSATSFELVLNADGTYQFYGHVEA